MIEVFLFFALLAAVLISLVFYQASASEGRLELAQQSGLRRDRENLALFDRRCAELEDQLKEGDIDQQSYEQLLFEAKDQLLNDTGVGRSDNTASSAPGGNTQRNIILLSCLAAIMVSLFIYLPFGLSLGANDQYVIRGQLASLRERPVTAAEAEGAERFDQFIETLQSYSRGLNPDVQILYLLAEAYRSTANYGDAAQVFKQLLQSENESAHLQTELAETRYLALLNVLAENGTRPGGSSRSAPNPAEWSEIRSLLSSALELDPEQPKALSMAGMMSFYEEDYPQALSYWQRALPLFPSRSAEAQSIRQGIQTALQRGGETLSDSAFSAWIDVDVQISLPQSALQIPPETPVFVFARAVEGPPMPLAAKRLTLGDLPIKLRLSNLDQMAGIGIDSVDEVQVQARLSLSGQPQSASGDYQSQPVVLTVKTLDGSKAIEQEDATILIINQLVP